MDSKKVILLIKELKRQKWQIYYKKGDQEEKGIHDHFIFLKFRWRDLKESLGFQEKP